jgi:hypothetical protein
LATRIDFKPVDFKPLEQSQEEPKIDFKPVDFKPLAATDEPSVAFQPIEFKAIDTPKEPAKVAEPGMITGDELMSLQKKYGLSPVQLEEVRRELPVMGAYVAGEEPTLPQKASRALGVVGRAAGVQGLASKLTREGVLGVGRKDEGVIRALEDVQSLINERKSGTETALELATGLVTPALVGKTLAGATAAGAVMGGAAGYGSTKEGEETASTAIGTTAGAALGAGGYKVAQVLGKFLGNSVAQEVTEGATAREFQQALAKEAEVAAPVQRIVEEAAKNPKLISDADTFATWYKTLPDDAKAVLLKSAPQDAGTEKLLKKAAGTETAEASLVYRAVRQELSDAASYIKGGGRIEKLAPMSPAQIEEVLEGANRQGQKFLKNSLDELYTGKAAMRVAADSLDAKFGTGQNPVKKYLKAVLDGRDRLGMIDERLGTGAEVAASKSARQMNRFTEDQFQVGQLAKKVDSLFRKLPGDQAIARQRVFDAIQDGSDDAIARLSVPEQGVVSTYKEVTNELAELLNRAAGERLLSPDAGRRYILNTVVDMPDFISRMAKRAEEVKKQTGIDILGEPDSFAGRLEELANNEAFKEFKQGLSLFGRKTDTAKEISFFGKQALSPTSLRENYQLFSTSLKAREGKIPDFLMEKDPVKLVMKWGENNLRPIYMNPFLSELKKVRNIALAKGDEEAAEYTSNLIADLTGTRQGTVASGVRDAMFGYQAKMLQKADRATGLAKGFYSVLARSPEVLPQLFNQVYPNFLGLSPRAILGNLTQPFTMMVPELGAPGTIYVMKAYGKLAPQIKGILGEGSRQKLLQEGLVGRQYSTELAALKSGLDKGNLWKVGTEVLQKQAEFAMYLFERSELINRMVAKEVGQDLAQNFIKGSGGMGKHAQRFAKSLPSAYQRALRDAGSDATKVTEVFQDYLIAKSLFNYNRQTLSAYGRFMGPLLSSFTKWPSSIAGDIVRTAMKENKIAAGGELAMRYLGPVAALSFLGSALPEDSQDSAAYKRVFGPDGPVSVAPLQSVKALAEGQIFTPPVISTVKDLGVGLLTADSSKLWQWANNTFEAFMPGAWVGRLLGSDIPAMFQEEKREGTFTQRVGESFGVSDIDEMFRRED